MIVRARHLENARFALTSGDQQCLSDQAPEYGGEGQGPMPSELLLWSVAACFGQAVRHVAAKRRQRLDGLVLEVTGVKDASRFCLAGVDIRLESDAPPAVLATIAQVARKYCFVTNSLAVPVTITIIGLAED